MCPMTCEECLVSRSRARESSVADQVFRAARDGHVDHLRTLLRDKHPHEIEKLLTAKTMTNAYKPSTPLMAAVCGGNYETVKVLLWEFAAAVNDPHTEQSAWCDDAKDTSALCAAVSMGYVRIMKQLLLFGADVNHRAGPYGITPLHTACYYGHADIVALLIDHHADLTLKLLFPYEGAESCLGLACMNCHVAVVSYLLAKGADPNEPDDGRFHLAVNARVGHLELVDELLSAGADVHCKDENNLTPIQIAAFCGYENMVALFTQSRSTTREDRVDGWEMLGAFLLLQGGFEKSTEKGYRYLRLAMEERHRGDRVLHKNLHHAVRAYGNHTECETLRDLASMKNDPYALHMESLMIVERMLGQDSWHVPYTIFPYVSQSPQLGFKRSHKLWTRALELIERNNIPYEITFFESIAESIRKFQQEGQPVESDRIGYLFLFLVNRLETHEEYLHRDYCCDYCYYEMQVRLPDIVSWNDANTRVALNMIALMLNAEENREDNPTLRTLVKRFLQLNTTISENGGIPHMLFLDWNLQSIHSVYKCSVLCFLSLLWECGVKLAAVDDQGETALHFIARLQPASSTTDFVTILPDVIAAFVEAGVDVEQRNYSGVPGVTAEELAGWDVVRTMLRGHRPVSLQRLAARVVRRFPEQCEGRIPWHLCEFISSLPIPPAST